MPGWAKGRQRVTGRATGGTGDAPGPDRVPGCRPVRVRAPVASACQTENPAVIALFIIAARNFCVMIGLPTLVGMGRIAGPPYPHMARLQLAECDGDDLPRWRPIASGRTSRAFRGRSSGLCGTDRRGAVEAAMANPAQRVRRDDFDAMETERTQVTDRLAVKDTTRLAIRFPLLSAHCLGVIVGRKTADQGRELVGRGAGFTARPRNRPKVALSQPGKETA